MNILPIYSNYISCKHIWENGGLNINDYEGRSKRLYEVENNLFRSWINIKYIVRERKNNLDHRFL